MREPVETGLPPPGQPFSWAVAGAGLLFTAHGPVLPGGGILRADITAQTRLTLDNLQAALRAGGASLDDVLQVQIYLLDAAHVPAVDAVYAARFRPPYPNRCMVVVAGLVAPGMLIELSAIAKRGAPADQQTPVRAGSAIPPPRS